MKTHFQIGLGDRSKTACGRGDRMSLRTFRVDCGLCILRNSFQEAHQAYTLEKERAFKAQVPAPVGEPWVNQNMVCPCGGSLFRYRGTTCMGHYDNWECAHCNETQSRLTETGMSH